MPDSAHGTNPATASMAGFKTVTITSDAGRRGRHRGAARGAGPADGGGDDHQPVHAGPLRAPRRGAARGGPRGRRAGLHGRRQHERDPGPLPAGRGRLRRHALQPAQDVLHAARRRRARSRSHRRGRAPRARTCPSRSCCARTTAASAWSGHGERPDVDRPHARLSGQRRGPRARLRLHPRPRRRAACARSARTPCSRPTTCARASGRPTTCPYEGPCKHEFVASAAAIKAAHRRAHLRHRQAAHRPRLPPADHLLPAHRRRGLLIEPTETESLETLDAFADALIAVARRPTRTPSC